MAVYITGDTHAEWMTRFNTKNFPEQRELSRDDFVIVLGDFGLWHDGKDEQYRLDWLQDKPWTTLWIDGNHENYDRIYSDEFDTVEFHGGQVQKIRDNVLHLMRGEVYDLCGKSFFTFGGARSHDIQDGILDPCDYKDGEEFARVYKQWSKAGKTFRVNHFSWWEQELPSQQEMDRGREVLESHDWKVDYVLTHCFPQSVASVAGFRDPDQLTQYFDGLLGNALQFKDWFCGHYHKEWDFGQFHIRYYKIERIV